MIEPTTVRKISVTGQPLCSSLQRAAHGYQHTDAAALQHAVEVALPHSRLGRQRAQRRLRCRRRRCRVSMIMVTVATMVAGRLLRQPPEYQQNVREMGGTPAP